MLFTLLFIYFIHVISYSCTYIFFICSHVTCTCTFQFILAHSLGVLTPWICISRSVVIYYWSGIGRGSQARWGARVSLFFIIGILSLLFMLFPDSIYIMSSCHLFPLFICYHWVIYLYVILQWYRFIVVSFIACSGHFRLSGYLWSIFLAYICRRLSSRLRFHVFWEAGVTMTIWVNNLEWWGLGPTQKTLPPCPDKEDSILCQIITNVILQLSPYFSTRVDR